MNPERPASGANENIPRDGITIEFAFATTPAYEEAVPLARKQPSYRQLGDGTGARHRVHYSWQELGALREFKTAAWELREKRAYVNGVELRWEHMAQVTYCFCEKMTRGRRDHCFFDGNHISPFGCRYTLTNLADRIGNEWLTYGQFEPEGAFRFDKERMRALARERLHSSHIHLCPAWDEEFLDCMVEAFPERINPGQDPRWRLMLTSKGEKIGVVPVDVNAAWSVVHELQEKVRARRGSEQVDETGKRLVPPNYVQKVSPGAGKKRGILAWLLGK